MRSSSSSAPTGSSVRMRSDLRVSGAKCRAALRSSPAASALAPAAGPTPQPRRKDMVRAILDDPAQAREIAMEGLGCVVTKDEHRLLAAVDPSSPRGRRVGALPSRRHRRVRHDQWPAH
jgi:hypothetical protein